jgi:hypothetical protein
LSTSFEPDQKAYQFWIVSLALSGLGPPFAANHSCQWAGEAGLFRHRQTILSDRLICGILHREISDSNNTL